MDTPDECVTHLVLLQDVPEKVRHFDVRSAPRGAAGPRVLGPPAEVTLGL
jgi:hypothetical protein